MKIINLLHFYQPNNQQEDILLRIVNESYRPLINGLLARPNAKLVINFPAVLSKLMLDTGYGDVIEGLATLLNCGQIEMTASAKYHAVLPLLPVNEIERQVDENELTNREIFGEAYQPKGFFAPEMAIDDTVLGIVARKGYQWIAAPQLSYGPEAPISNRVFVDDNSGLTLMFRHKRISILILGALVRNATELINETADLVANETYWFTAMDAETFGHHRIGHERFLFDILDNSFFEPMLASELIQLDMQRERIHIRPSSWSNEEQDFWLDKEHTQATSAKSFILWKDPSNPIHKLQWELTQLVIDQLLNYPDHQAREWQVARERLDCAIASDQYWWASAKPWWSLEMIEQGAYALKEVLAGLPIPTEVFDQVEQYYRNILDQAFNWQRTGYVRKQHLENSGTFLKTPFKQRTSAEWCNQIILEMEHAMLKAAAAMNFEQAIKWRDAIYKISLGTDIYDVLHVVDEFFLARSLPWNATEVKPFFSHSWGEFSDFAKAHFVEYTTKEKFEAGQEKSPFKNQ